MSMLKNCGRFYRRYPHIRQSLPGEFAAIPARPEIGQSAIGEFDPGLPAHLLGLSWTHFIELIRIDDPLKRAFYEAECLHGHWSIRQLQRQIGSLLYERTGLSTDKESIIRRASSQDSPASIATLLRDPYVLKFAGLAIRNSAETKDVFLCPLRGNARKPLRSSSKTRSHLIERATIHGPFVEVHDPSIRRAFPLPRGHIPSCRSRQPTTSFSQLTEC